MSLPLQFILCVLIWGGTWIAITTQLDGVASAWSIAYRFAIAALILHALALTQPRSRRALTWGDHGFMLGFGLCQFSFNMLLIYEAERHVASGLVAVVFALMVVTNPAMAQLALGERHSRLVWAGGLVAVAGVGLLYLEDLSSVSMSTAAITGLSLAAGGTLIASMGNLFPASSRGRRLTSMQMNSWGMSYGMLASAAVALSTSGAPKLPTDPLYWLGLLYLALFGSVIAFTFYLNVIRGWGITRASYSSVLIPVVALGLSWLFEDYQWTMDALAGAVLVSAGTMMALRGRRR